MVSTTPNVTQNIVSQSSVRNLSRIQAKVFDGLAYRNPLRIPTAQKILVESADKRPATNKGCTEAKPLLLGEADDFNSERKMSPIQSLHQRNGKNHAENAIKGASVGDRIQVRTQEQPRGF
jgi:hypothetical protein